MPSLASYPATHNNKPVPPIHPGRFLREELMKPLAISQNALAKATGIPVSRINQIVLERRSITAETDLRLARYFGMTPGYFLRWQASFDLRTAEMAMGKVIKREVRPRPRVA
jgi:addiction module HigA family antidote